MDWQPIITVPKNKNVLLTQKGSVHIFIGKYLTPFTEEVKYSEEFHQIKNALDESEDGLFYYPQGWWKYFNTHTGNQRDYVYCMESEHPTHWLPLPEPLGHDSKTPHSLSAVIKAIWREIIE